MIQLTLSYLDLLWLLLLYCLSQFLYGIGKGIGLEWKRRKLDSEKDKR